MTNGSPASGSVPEDIDGRLRAVEQGVVRIEARLDAEFGRINAEFGRVNTEFRRLESKMDSKFDAVDSTMETRFGQVDARFDQFEQRLDQRMAVFETRIMEKQVSATRWMLGLVAIALISMAVA